MSRWIVLYEICVYMNEPLQHRCLIDTEKYFYMYDSRHMLLSVG